MAPLPNQPKSPPFWALLWIVAVFGGQRGEILTCQDACLQLLGQRQRFRIVARRRRRGGRRRARRQGVAVGASGARGVARRLRFPHAQQDVACMDLFGRRRHVLCTDDLQPVYPAADALR